MGKHLLILLILSFCTYDSWCQDFLMLNQPGAKKRIKFYEGDRLTYRLKGSEYFQSDRISDLKKDSIFFLTYAVPLESIEIVDLRDIKKSRMLGNAAILGGILYILVDQFNHTVVKQRGWNVNGTVARTSGILVLTGLIINKTRKKYFRVNGKKKLTIVTF